MSILSGLTPPLKLSACRLIRVAEELSKEDKEILLDAVKNPVWSASALSKELRVRGLVLSRAAIDGHRNSTCICNA